MKCISFKPQCTPECHVDGWIHCVNHSPEMLQRMHPAVIICPGGGYEFLSDREMDPVAEPFYAAGYNTFVLHYSLGAEAADLHPLIQLASTVAYIRQNSEELFTDTNAVSVCGFSAGGHLVASLGVFHDDPAFLKAYSLPCNPRPDAMILCYPVITSDEFAHVGSISTVSGASVGTETYRWYGLDQHVHASTPPAFLWHAADDTVVPVENTLKFASALSSANIPFELHILPEGGHGLSVCTSQVDKNLPYNARWVQWCIAWLNQQFNFHV